jgi:hypothetical protein
MELRNSGKRVRIKSIKKEVHAETRSPRSGETSDWREEVGQPAGSPERGERCGHARVQSGGSLSLNSALSASPREILRLFIFLSF